LQRRRQSGDSRGPALLNKIYPPARGLVRHNKRFALEEIIKIVATRCHILRLKCTKLFVGWGFAPDPLDFRGLLIRGGKGQKGKRQKGKGGGERGEEGRGWEGKGGLGRRGMGGRERGGLGRPPS